MTDLRGWGLSEQHLLPDAVVAFVDGELSTTAHGRVIAHLARCPYCAAEAFSQQQARTAVRAAETPSCPRGLLDNLRAIPQEVELPSMPDNLAVTEDGQLVTVLRPDRAGGGFGSGPVLGTPPLGSTAPLGSGSAVLGRFGGRRARHGAGVVVSGLMLGALALVTPNADPAQQDRPSPPRVAGGPAIHADTAVSPLLADENERVDLLRSVVNGR